MSFGILHRVTLVRTDFRKRQLLLEPNGVISQKPFVTISTCFNSDIARGYLTNCATNYLLNLTTKWGIKGNAKYLFPSVWPAQYRWCSSGESLLRVGAVITGGCVPWTTKLALPLLLIQRKGTSIGNRLCYNHCEVCYAIKHNKIEEWRLLGCYVVWLL
jgi:hypothetical protein